MAAKYLRGKWIAPSAPLPTMWLYTLTMKVYETPGWLDGVVWSFLSLLTIGILAVNYHAKFVDPVIKE